MDLRKQFEQETGCEAFENLDKYRVPNPGYVHWLESRMQWISIKDRLPEEGALVTVCNGDIAWTMVYNSIDVDRLFTHWMPLPPPPKTE